METQNVLEGHNKNSKSGYNNFSAIAIIYDVHNFAKWNLMKFCFFSIDFVCGKYGTKYSRIDQVKLVEYSF